MNINPLSSRRLLVLALVLSFVLPALGTYNTAATQGTNTELLVKADGAVRNAQNEFILAESKKLDAEARLEELQKFSDFAEPDNSSLQKMGSLARTVDRMFEPGSEKTLQKQLDDAVTALEAATTRLNSVKTPLDAATSTDKIETEKIETAKTAVSENLKAIGDLKTELGTSKTNLNTALVKIYGQVAAVAKTADNRLKHFDPPPTEAPLILSLFRTKLSEVPSLMQFQVDLQESWNNLSAKLANVVDGHAGKVDQQVKPALTTLKESVETVAKKINVPVKTLADDTKTREKTLFEESDAFTKNPAAEERKALRSIQENRRHADALDKIASIVGLVITQAELSIAGFDKTATTDALDALNENTILLRKQSATFDALLTGDRSLWTTEKIRLYYFTDIPRLIQTLNPDARLTGGDPSARQRAEDRLDKLRAAEDVQTEANGNVSSLKRRVLSLQQELRQANAELNAAKILSQSAGRKHAELERRPAGNVPPERMARSLEEKNAREQDLLAAQERADRLNDQTNGLAAQLRDAEAQLEIAQAAFERASSATIRAAQVESTAFANARDNAPFWFAEGLPTNTDPARRVDITSSTNGENAIFIRGRKEDIVKVQDIVAKLDEPAPQARMTLWKIELNSDATKKGAERFNDALQIVEQELANTRAKIADTLSLLLGSVSEQAELAAMKNNGRPFDRKDCHELARYQELRFPGPIGTDITGRLQRLKRYSLYSDEVRQELGIDFIDELGFDNPKQFGLKDPASATTLNEALIILLLTDRDSRKKIMNRFEDNLRQNLLNNADKDEKKALLKREGVYLKRLRSMLGLNQTTEASNNFETTRQQQELIYAMRGPLLRHLVGRIVALQSRVPEFVRLDKKTRTPKEDALYQCLYEKLPKIFDTIHDEFPISPLGILDEKVQLFQPGDGTIGLRLYDDNRQLVAERIYNLRPSPARVAAADGMLDVFTKAFEDDIDREYVQPMLSNLRKQLKRTGIGFGVIQRTSVLATNRLVARVDPRATSELSVGEETNLLQGLQSISQIALAAQTGGVLGGISQLRASAAQEKDAAEIYGITSGSAFQVTPIFDPTGQALRFKFDFVDTTLVREPRGTTNPRLPRVERHTVNTEVQLANLEIREVSRFESDAKVGLPTTYRGGLPILKDIPGVRPIPLIGWFIRRKGSNAIAQRSLIFAQTTMSPTIGDILDLFDTSLQRR